MLLMAKPVATARDGPYKGGLSSFVFLSPPSAIRNPQSVRGFHGRTSNVHSRAQQLQGFLGGGPCPADEQAIDPPEPFWAA